MRLFVLFLCLLALPAIAADLPISKGHNRNSPIEINADSLEVLQQENKAIFTGHVVAVQGGVHLKSEKMTVLYKKSENSASSSSKKTSLTPDAGGQNAIDKILVDKNVFLSTAEETASGNSGIYDVSNQKIFLNGDVVLTKDKNVLKGSKLVYDFASGRSVIDSANATVGADGKKGRVKALFIPNKK